MDPRGKLTLSSVPFARALHQMSGHCLPRQSGTTLVRLCQELKSLLVTGTILSGPESPPPLWCVWVLNLLARQKVVFRCLPFELLYLELVP